MGAAAALLGLLARPALSAPAVASIGLFAAFVAWSGLSVVWSIESDRSWDYFNRDLAYLAFLVAGVLAGGLSARAPRLLAAGLAALLGAVVVWALAGKVVPALGPDVSRNARLRSPVGYWNALAVLCDMAFVLGLWLAVPVGRRRAVRVAGALLAYGAGVALGLTLSRGGIAIGVLAVAALVLLGWPLLETLAAAALAALPALALVAWATTRPALVDGAVGHAARVHDGWIFGVLLAAGAALVAAAAYALSPAADQPVAPERRRTLTRAVVAVLVGAAAVVLLALVARAGGPGDFARARWHEFSNPAPVSEGAARLSAGSSNYRWTWWRQAWSTFEDHPVKGSGAGSFELAHRLYRTTYSPPAREPHDLPLQVLSETGAVGVWLFLAAALAAGIGIAGALRRRRGEAHAAAVALVACVIAYCAHVLVDSGWDYVALSGPVFFIVGVLLAFPAAAGARRRPFAAIAALALAAVAVSSLATPWLAARRVDAAYTAYADGRLAGAVRDAKDARGLNPLSLDAVSTLALMQEAGAHDRAAWRAYLDATDLQPLNPDAWYALGAFEVQTLHDCLLGYRHLNRSYTLDRYGPAGEAGGLLDQARASVNAGRARCTTS